MTDIRIGDRFKIEVEVQTRLPVPAGTHTYSHVRVVREKDFDLEGEVFAASDSLLLASERIERPIAEAPKEHRAMKLEDIDQVTAFRNYRREAMKIKNRAFNSVIDLRLNAEHVFSHIPAEPIRQAIADACDAEIAKWEAELRALGVSMEGGE